MRLRVENSCDEFASFRAARVRSLFNCESGARFTHEATLDIDDGDWRLGVIVGPSGSGKTSLGRLVFGDEAALYDASGWPDNQPIIDAIGVGKPMDDVTGALAQVGLGSVPSWLRPYRVLSMGERFRADLARIVCDAPAQIVVDEFTSVVDRQIAKIGAMAFAKAWRRTGGKAVLLSCHYDILDWLQPDWVYDTGKGQFQRGCLWRRPPIHLDVFETDGRYWPLFAPHYYLTLPRMIAPTYYVGAVDGEPVCHLALSPRLEVGGIRASRMVVLPEWQGAGLGLRFLNAIAEEQVSGRGRWKDRIRAVYFHTSHPGLAAALRRDSRWTQMSAELHGASRRGAKGRLGNNRTGYGGHWRAVQGFRYARQLREGAGSDAGA